MERGQPCPRVSNRTKIQAFSANSNAAAWANRERHRLVEFPIFKNFVADGEFNSGEKLITETQRHKEKA